MSKEKFIKNSVIYTLGDMLPKVIAFFMQRVYTGYLSTAEYGIVNIVSVVMGFFSMFYLLGLDGALTRFYYDQKDNEKQRVFISTLWISLFVYNLVITIMFILFGQGISRIIFKSVPFDPFFKVMVIMCFFNTFSVMPMIIFRLREQAFKFGLLNILTTIMNIALIIYFIVFLKEGALGNLKAMLFTSVFFSTLYFIMTFKDLSFKFSPKILAEGLKYGIPLIPHSIGSWVLMMSDRIFLEKYSSLGETGIYGFAYNLGLPLYYLICAINKAYVPFFFKTAVEEENAKSTFEDVIRYYSVFILSVGLGLAIFSKEFTLLMSGNKAFYAAISVVPIIALAYIFDGFYFMTVNGIFYARKTPVLALTTGITAIVDVILNILLIPAFGMYGAAFATAGAYLIEFILTYFVSQKYYYIKWHWRVILLNVILAVTVYFLGTLGPSMLWMNFAFKTLIYIIYVAALFVLKILSFDKLKIYGVKIFKR